MKKKSKKLDIEKEIKRLKLKIKLTKIFGWIIISCLALGIFAVLGSYYAWKYLCIENQEMNEYLIGAVSSLIVIILITNWLLFAIMELMERFCNKKGSKLLQYIVIRSCECLFIISMIYCFYLLIYYITHLVGLS